MPGKIIALLTALALALTMGCGGGGSVSGSGSGNPARDSKALTKVKTAGLLADGEILGAIQLTISIPRGVTVALDPATGRPASGVVSLTGATDPNLVFQYSRYTPPTATASGSLSFLVVNAQGFGPAEYIGIQLDITPGYFPVAGDFVVSDFAVAGITNYTQTQITNPTVSVAIN